MKGVIVILHGWGSLMSGEQRFKEVKKLLEDKGYTVFTPDLPGFGKNTLQKDALVFEDYVTFVEKFIKEVIQQKRVKKVVLVGHSFGGRIAIRVTSKNSTNIDRLILTGASGIPRPLPSLKKRVAYVVTKVIGPLFTIPPFSFFYSFLRKLVYYSIGEMDYYKAGKLSQTFKNVYQVSIVSDLAEIKVPTLLLWGENDTMTPLADGKLIHKEIKNSQFIVVPDATHKLPYENPSVFVKEVVKFLT